MKIAFFDFDGTITTSDTLIKFIRFAIGDLKFIFGMIVLSPMLLLYKLKVIPNYKAKQMLISWFFKDMDEERFKDLANEYSLKHIDSILNLDAIDKLKWHKEQNHKIVIVSASMECWIQAWARKNNYELIATKLEMKDRKLTGKFLTKNCFGQEKVNRIKEKYNLDEYEFIYAYGDSSGDKEMLSIANQGFYRKFI